MTHQRLVRDILKIGDAVVWCRRCHGIVDDQLDLLTTEITAARYEPGLLFVRALKAIERHHADPAVQANWIIVARALEHCIRSDLVKMTDLALFDSASPVRP